jgi:hypothetical protein
MSYRIRYEFQDISGSWITVNSSDGTNPQGIAVRLAELKRSYPDRRCRAVDDAGRVIDIAN